MTGAPWPLSLSAVVLLASALVLVWAGVRFTRVVDQLADRLGIGEAIAGAVLLGATTSLPGLIVTCVAAWDGEAELAISNAFGGIAAQTMFLAVADLFYRRANLEHAAASLPNLLQAMLLIALIGAVLLAALGPQGSWWGLHPVSLILPLGYVYGLSLSRRAAEDPMWRPRRTRETKLDVPEEEALRASLARLWAQFLLLGLVVSLCGYGVARAGVSVAAHTGISGTLVGGLLTAVVTSLPELVTVIAAVRMGALTLAVGDIIGGNTFDVLFVAAGDLAYREGPIYAAMGPGPLFLCALTVLLTAILAAGLLYREKTGIGFEGTAILVCYCAGFVALAFIS